MRRRFGQALRIGVSGSEVCLLRTSGWGAAAAAPELLARAELAQGAPAGLPAALAGVLADGGFAGWPVRVVLADDLLRLVQVTPPDGVARLADVQGAAALRFQSLYGESAAQWRMMADWDNRRPFFAAAVPRALLAALEEGAHAHRLALVAVVPHFIGAWNRWQDALKAGAWFGTVHDGLLTLGAVEAGQLRAVRALPLPQAVDADWLGHSVRREALLLGLGAPALLQLCGQVPPAWSKPIASAGQLATALLDRELQLAAAGMPAAARLALQGGGR